MKTGRGQGRPSELRPRWPSRAGDVLHRRPGGRRYRSLRRICALSLLLCAAALALARPIAPAPGTPVAVLTRDLPAGATLSTGDISLQRRMGIPDGAITDTKVAGRQLSGPIRRGEVLTDVRLVPPDGPDPGPGRVAVPITPTDSQVVDLLKPGMHVAVIAVNRNGGLNGGSTTGSEPESGAEFGTTLAPDAVVLAVPAAGGGTGPAADRNAPRLVVLAVPTAVADRLAAVGVDGQLAVRFT